MYFAIFCCIHSYAFKGLIFYSVILDRLRMGITVPCSTSGRCEICLQIFIKILNYSKGLSLDKIIVLILIVCKCN